MMPWDETEEYVRHRQRNPEEFQQETFRTVTLSEKDGIKAVMGKLLGKHVMEVQSYLFEKGKGWTIEKAKEWLLKHPDSSKEHVYAVLPFTVNEKVLEKPLRISGVAMTAGMSRNFNIYTPDELQAFAGKLVDAPMYIEHVSAADAVGKVTAANWDGENLTYEAEIYDEDTAAKIRTGLIRHISVGADYETVDLVQGKIPHGLNNAEISLVAVPGIPAANIQVIEKLHVDEQTAKHNPSTMLPICAQSVVSEHLFKKPSEPTIPISEAVSLIEAVLPSPMVQRSWSLGPQRMCQELRRAVLKLRGASDGHLFDRE